MLPFFLSPLSPVLLTEVLRHQSIANFRLQLRLGAHLGRKIMGGCLKKINKLTNKLNIQPPTVSVKSQNLLKYQMGAYLQMS